jgi:hypothetical protein
MFGPTSRRDVHPARRSRTASMRFHQFCGGALGHRQPFMKHFTS